MRRNVWHPTFTSTTEFVYEAQISQAHKPRLTFLVMPPKFSSATEHFMGDPGALSVADFQKQIAERTKSLALEIQALHRRHNSVNPSHRLPPEILTRIFAILSSEWTWWIRVTHICHYWRVVALDCADLWSRITFPNIGFTKAKLAHSKDLPLTVTSKSKTFASREHLALALTSPNRLRQVSLEGEASTYLALLANWTGPCPTLETLSLKVPGLWNCLPDSFLQWSIGVPSLTTLDFTFSGSMWRILPLGRSTTTLRLCERSGQSDRYRPSVKEFLQSMKNMPLLRVIHLEYILPLQEHSLPPPFTSSPLHFPALRHLNVKDRVEHIAQFFSVVRIPDCTTHIQIAFVALGATGQAEQAAASSALQYFKLSLGIIDTPILVQEVDISIPTYRFSSPHSNASQPDRRVIEVSTGVWEPNNLDLMTMYKGIFDFSTIQSVTVRTSEPTSRRLDTWQYLGSLPNIATIELTGSVPDCLFDLLKARILPSILGPKPAYFPALVSLCFNEVGLSIHQSLSKAKLWHFTQRLIEAFRERGKLLHPLPELHIRGFTAIGVDEVECIRKALPRLKLVAWSKHNGQIEGGVGVEE